YVGAKVKRKLELGAMSCASFIENKMVVEVETKGRATITEYPCVIAAAKSSWPQKNEAPRRMIAHAKPRLSMGSMNTSSIPKRHSPSHADGHRDSMGPCRP